MSPSKPGLSISGQPDALPLMIGQIALIASGQQILL